MAASNVTPPPIPIIPEIIDDRMAAVKRNSVVIWVVPILNVFHLSNELIISKTRNIYDFRSQPSHGVME